MRASGDLCQEEYVMLVARKKMFVEERFVLKAISYAQSAFTVDFLGQHVHLAHCVESL